MASGQRPLTPTRGPGAFARFVPDSTEMLFTFSRLDEANDVLHRLQAWRVLTAMAGLPVGDQPIDLPMLIREFGGREGGFSDEELAGLEAALALSSWREPSEAVLYLRLPDAHAVKRWFPSARPVEQEGDHSVAIYRTRFNRTLCVREGIAAVARQTRDDAHLQHVMGLMSGQRRDALSALPEFERMRTRLPLRALAYVYTASPPRAHDAAGQRPAKNAPTHRPKTMLALYERDGRLDVAIRGTTPADKPDPAVTPSAIEQMLDLPRTTLMATATTLECLERKYLEGLSASEAMARYAVLWQAMRGRSADEEASSPFGSEVILAWGQGWGDNLSTPQLGMLVECVDAAGCSRWANDVADRLLGLLRAGDPELADLLTLNRRSMYGVPATTLDLERFAESSSQIWGLWLDGLSPSWAIRRGWLLVTLHQEHLESILESQFGLVPTLGTLGDAPGLRQWRADRSLVTIMQPHLAADVAAHWFGFGEHGPAESPAWWTAFTAPARSAENRLGIGIYSRQDPGVVLVARVDPGTAAEGRLEPGDRIVGIDGQLLDMAAPNADLRRRWQTGTSVSTMTFRVLRDDELVEVQLPRRPSGRDDGGATLEVWRELTALGRLLPFASLVMNASDGSFYSARVSLRLSVPSKDEE